MANSHELLFGSVLAVLFLCLTWPSESVNPQWPRYIVLDKKNIWPQQTGDHALLIQES